MFETTIIENLPQIECPHQTTDEESAENTKTAHMQNKQTNNKNPS